MLVTNLHVLEAELIWAGEGEVLRRPDWELLEAAGADLEEMMGEAVAAQLTYECVLAGTDRQQEVARRRALFTIGVKRGWNFCGWCEEEVDLYEWATGRLCGHQFHHVSRLIMMYDGRGTT